MLSDQRYGIGALLEQSCAAHRENVSRFLKKFKDGTSDPNNFMTISEIESLWQEMDREYHRQSRELMSRAISSINESTLIAVKKNNMPH